MADEDDGVGPLFVGMMIAAIAVVIVLEWCGVSQAVRVWLNEVMG